MTDNHETKKLEARIGMVNFINTAPLYETWKSTVHRPEWQVTAAEPAVLNRMLFEDRLDLGFISSFEYGLHPGMYRILGDLSISSTGKVGSVFLFLKNEPAALSGKAVLLSSQSMTSVALVRIILEEFYQVRPTYSSGAVMAALAQAETPEAILAIGDDALRLAGLGIYPVKLDLSEVWRECTGLPFVFAVWAVREEFLAQYPEALAAIHRELCRCVVQGKKNLRDISLLAATRIPMEPEACYEYLCGIEYDLSWEKQQALSLFFNYLIIRGEADAAALPLKILKLC